MEGGVKRGILFTWLDEVNSPHTMYYVAGPDKRTADPVQPRQLDQPTDERF